MSLLPRVTEKARELIARELDARGPDVCMAEIIEHLERHNPELLDMAARCAADLKDPGKAMVGFGVFLRPVPAEFPLPRRRSCLNPLARRGGGTGAAPVGEIDEKGAAAFPRE